MDPKGDYEDFELPLEKPGESVFFSYQTYHKLFVERWSFTVGALTLALAALFVLVTTGKTGVYPRLL